MRLNVFLFLFILTSSVGFAQSDTKLYYSIDAKGWATAEERNQYESKLEVQLLNDITTILLNNSEAAEDCSMAKNRIEFEFQVLNAMREYNEQIGEILTPKMLDALKSKGVELTPTKAMNNELFGMSEIANCVDIFISEFIYFSQWVQATVKAEKYSSPITQAFEQRDATEFEKSKKYKDALDKKIAIVAQTLNEKADEEDAKSGRVATSYLADNGYMFYSFDGGEHKTRDERNLRNEQLKNRMRELVPSMAYAPDEDQENIELLTNLIEIVFAQISILDDWMIVLDNKPHYNDLVALVNKTAPGIELGVYQSKNKETFFLSEMAGSYDKVCSMYLLLDEMLLANLKNKIDVMQDVEERRNGDGENISTLLNELQELMDKVNTKYELMDKL